MLHVAKSQLSPKDLNGYTENEKSQSWPRPEKCKKWKRHNWD